jgi:alpha-1,6-mannosyltransferase
MVAMTRSWRSWLGLRWPLADANVQQHALTTEQRVLALGGATAALYALTWLILRGIARNAVTAWPSIIDPSHPADLRLLLVQVCGYVAVTLLIFWCYLRVLALCRSGELMAGRARIWALLLPLLIDLMLAPMVPRLSQDLFSYLAHGLLGVIPGDNPLTRPADAVRDAVVGANLVTFGWHAYPGITPYGILWTHIEVEIARLSGGNVLVAMLLFKGVAIAASLATAWMIWLVLGRIRPDLQLQGTLAYLWNPLVLMEFAGEGHNDAVMSFFALAALAACVSSRPALSVGAQLLGAITKYVSVLFLPAQLMYLWRTRRNRHLLALQVLLAGGAIIALTVALYVPYWAGFHNSFFGILRRPVPNGLASLFGAVGMLLRRTPLKPISEPLRALLLTAPLLGYIAWSSLRMRDARDLARAFAWTAVIFLLVSSPDYWPWYATMPVALLCASDCEELLWLVLLLSLAGRIVAPSELIHDRGYFGIKASKAVITGLGSLLPLMVLCYRLWRAWRQTLPRPTRSPWSLWPGQQHASPQVRRLR